MYTVQRWPGQLIKNLLFTQRVMDHHHQDTSKDGSSDPTYAQPEFTRKVAMSPPAATERLYTEITFLYARE